jgi:hypothetical protein
VHHSPELRGRDKVWKNSSSVTQNFVAEQFENTASSREGNQKLEWDWCAHCTGMNIEILNWPGPPWEAN